MKKIRPYPIITISRKAERSLQGGHPWVYDTEVLRTSGAITNGCLVDVSTEGGKYMGTGMYSEHSKIRIRLISRNANDRFDSAFWERRIRYAWEYRKTVMGPDTDCCRLIYGESDQFPGLTVDRFNDILVTQTLSYGMDLLKPVIFPLLRKVLSEDGQCIRGIYERNDSSLREKEGLPQYKGWYLPDSEPACGGQSETSAQNNADSIPTVFPGVSPQENAAGSPAASCRSPKDITGAKEQSSSSTLNPVVEITENGINYLVDVENGQKTGYFLDQKYNRQAVARLSSGRRVLDCFTHTGSFALNAAKGGADFVCAVDISETAIRMARDNASRNGLEDRIEFRVADVFDLLSALDQHHTEKYDFIILDPPAFTKSRRTVDRARAGYKEINLRAMKILPRGGYLATCSCSHFMSCEQFSQLLRDAAYDAGVQLRQIEARQQAPDHPVLWNVPETEYLKFYLFQVV